MPSDTLDRSTTDRVRRRARFRLASNFPWKSDGYLCEQDASQAHLPGQMKHEMHLSDSTERHSARRVGPNSPQKVTSETLLRAV